MLFSLLLLLLKYVVIAFMQVIWKEWSVHNALTDFKWVVDVLLLFFQGWINVASFFPVVLLQLCKGFMLPVLTLFFLSIFF